MFPKHCREVSVKKVSFPLTENEIIKRSVGKMVYALTNYIILTNDADWAVIKIERAENQGLFKTIKEVQIISLPKETAFVEDPTVDVLNPSAMVKVAEEERKETIVVKGKFEHVSFVHCEKPTPLIVLDIVPPDPPKLLELVERALSIGRVQEPIKIVPNIIDLRALAEANKTLFTMFPCTTSDLKHRANTLFLDQALEISSIGVENITLIGCDLSLKTFTSLYGKKPAFIDMCPRNRIVKEGAINRCISRCCIVDEGYERIEGVAYVPWGAKVSEVEEAILDLFESY